VSDILSDFNQIWNCREIFIKISSIKFRENQSNGSRPHTCEMMDGWTHTTKLTDPFSAKGNGSKIIRSLAFLFSLPGTKFCFK
jgi:hypothetical protein